MRKATKLYLLLGVLGVICAAAFMVSHYEEKKEQIKNSGEIILEIPTDDVAALSWTNESGTFSFSRGDSWTYDEDSAFPVDEEKINDLLTQFESFAAAFVIDNVEDYAQYGLDEPVCTISITAGEESYTIELGDFSKMDEQRYVSIGDGKAYLVDHDPLEEYNAVLSDMILDDTIPAFDAAEQIVFSGNENYTIVRNEDAASICEDDIYFTDGKPLDTDNVNSFLSAVRGFSLTDYVTYNVTDEELASYGLDTPELTIQLDYNVSVDAETEGTDAESAESESFESESAESESSGSLLLEVSRNPEEAAAYDQAVQKEEEEPPDVACYVRVNQSQIVYEISQSEYDALTDVSYNTLRHQKIFTADFDTVTSIDVTLSGENYTFNCQASKDQDNKDENDTWTYQDEEFDIQDLQNALCALSASEFTEETPDGQEEISVTVHLNNADFPTVTVTIYRYDGTNCIAVVDGTPVAFVSRSQTVNLIEAVNELTLGQ